MAEEVIRSTEAVKGCLFTCGISFLIIVLSAVVYFIYSFYFDDSLVTF